MKQNITTKNLTLCALFLAMGIVLPILTGQIPQIGNMLLPMHIPIYLCAFICGGGWAGVIAVTLPIIRSLIFGVPNFYPEALAISLEMLTYALVSGIIYNKSKNQNAIIVFFSLIIAMCLGRIVRCFSQFLLLTINGAKFSVKAFFVGVIATGVLGEILHLVLIPLIMIILNKTKAFSQ